MEIESWPNNVEYIVLAGVFFFFSKEIWSYYNLISNSRVPFWVILTLELHLCSPKNHPGIHPMFHYGTIVTLIIYPKSFFKKIIFSNHGMVKMKPVTTSSIKSYQSTIMTRVVTDVRVRLLSFFRDLCYHLFPFLISSMFLFFQTTYSLKISLWRWSQLSDISCPMTILLCKESDPQNGRFEMHYVDHLL